MTDNYKRIAKNTIFLYFRMIVIMAVSFYTIRVVLDTLGVTDFGLYNLVASFVLIMAFLNNTLTSGTQRFLTFEIGKSDVVKLKQTFSTALLIHIALAFLILILGETIGLWFLYEKMNIPVDRFDAAFWVYQFAIASTMITVMQVPYNALIIAHEKMHIFAYISIIEAILKLLVVYLLLVISFDKLIVYGTLMFLVSLFIAMFYRTYVIKNYEESHFSLSFDKDILKPILQFSGWNLFGSLAWIIMNQGINILLNILYGPALVAARVITLQINMGLLTLVNGFRTALNPQIIKNYSSGNLEEMKTLSLISAKYTFYLALFLILPVYLELETILSIWLVDVPEWTILFTQLILIFTLIQTFDLSFGIIFQATGDMKYNQIMSGAIYLSVIPIYLMINYFYKLSPSAIFYIQIIAGIAVAFGVKIYLLKRIIGITLSVYFKLIILPILRILFIILIFNLIIESFNFHLLLNMISNSILLLLLIWVFDIDEKIKEKIVQKFIKKDRIGDTNEKYRIK